MSSYPDHYDFFPITMCIIRVVKECACMDTKSISHYLQRISRLIVKVSVLLQDFLESVVEGEPRPRFKRKRLTDVEVKEMMRRMPKLHKNNENFFRGLGSKGIISFSEYLFLLTILIKPQSGSDMDRFWQ